MKIGVIGTGQVGAILAKRWAQQGHEIFYGTRDPQQSRIKSLIEETGDSAQAMSINDAMGQSDIIVLALPFRNVEDILKKAGSLEGKTIIDCSNPLKEDLSGLTLGFDNSAAEEISRLAKGANVVKAFNTIGTAVMKNPIYGNDKAVLFICGDDADSKKITTHLAEELDFNVVDAGDLKMARCLESLALMWIKLAFVQGMNPDFGLKFITR